MDSPLPLPYPHLSFGVVARFEDHCLAFEDFEKRSPLARNLPAAAEDESELEDAMIPSLRQQSVRLPLPSNDWRSGVLLSAE